LKNTYLYEKSLQAAASIPNDICLDLSEPICIFCSPTEQAACKCFEQLNISTANAYAPQIEALCVGLLPTNKLEVCARLRAMTPAQQASFLRSDIGDIAPIGGLYHIKARIPQINGDIVEAWKMVYSAKGELRYKKDMPLLTQVAKMQNNRTIITRLGGEEAFTDIIRKNRFAPCNTCTGSTTKYSLMHHYLMDVEYFAQNYSNKDGYDLVRGNQGMRNGGGHQVGATAFVIRTLHNPNIVNTVTGFETIIETINDADETNTAYADIVQEGNKIVECKSWELNGKAFQKFVEGTSGSVAQFKTYLSDQTRVTSMNQLEYWFDSKKGVNAPQVKEKFKLMMYNNGAEPGLTPQGLQVFDSIWGNLALRSSIWNNIPVNPNKADYQSRFAAIAADSNNSFYNFIKVK